MSSIKTPADSVILSYLKSDMEASDSKALESKMAGLFFGPIKTAKSNLKEQLIPHTFHAVELEDPKATRKEYPFTGFIDFQGILIDVENNKGSTRSGVGPEGPWSTHMFAHYGEIRDTQGVDGDKLDVYVGPNHDSSLVVVIHQHNPWDGAYDEDKVMLGFESVEEAVGVFKKHYDRPGFYKEGEHLAMPIGAFWRWVKDKNNKNKKVKLAKQNFRLAAMVESVVARVVAGTDPMAGVMKRGNALLIQTQKDFDAILSRIPKEMWQGASYTLEVSKMKWGVSGTHIIGHLLLTFIGTSVGGLDSQKTSLIYKRGEGLRVSVEVNRHHLSGDYWGDDWVRTTRYIRDSFLGIATNTAKKLEAAYVANQSKNQNSLQSVTSFLKRMRTQIGGSTLSVETSGSRAGHYLWEVEPRNRQRLDHYVGSNADLDEYGEEPQGWDEDGWTNDYAEPLENEVRTKLDAEFGRGLFMIDIGEKGHININLTPKGEEELVGRP